MAKSNQIIILGVAALGIYFLTTKKVTAKTITQKPIEKDKYTPPIIPPIPSIPGLKYNCNSIKIIDRKLSQEALRNKLNDVISELKITKDNMTSIDPFAFSEALMNKINPSCIKDPESMTLTEKIIYFLIVSGMLEGLEILIGSKYDPDMDYPDLESVKGINCDISGKPGDFSTCEFIVFTDSPDYIKLRNAIKVYVYEIADYLNILDKENEIKAASKQLQETGSYP